MEVEGTRSFIIPLTDMARDYYPDLMVDDIQRDVEDAVNLIKSEEVPLASVL